MKSAFQNLHENSYASSSSTFDRFSILVELLVANSRKRIELLLLRECRSSNRVFGEIVVNTSGFKHCRYSFAPRLGLRPFAPMGPHKF